METWSAGTEREQAGMGVVRDHYRRIGRWLAEAVLFVLVVDVALQLWAAFDPAGRALVRDGLGRLLFDQAAIPPAAIVLLALTAATLWLLSRDRGRPARFTLTMLLVATPTLIVVDIACTFVATPWCLSARAVGLVPSSQASGTLGLIGVATQLARSRSTVAGRLRIGTLCVAGAVSVGTATASVLGYGGWSLLPRVRPMFGLTAVLVVVLVVAAVAVLPERWPLSRLVRTESDQAIVDHLLPWILAVPAFPIVAGVVGRLLGSGPALVAVMIAVGPVAMLLIALGVALGEQRTVAHQLAVAMRQYAMTVEQAPIGIALVSPDGHFMDVNKRLCELFERDRAELLTLTVDELTHPEDLPEDLELIAACLRGDASRYDMEKRYLLPDGRWLPTQLSKSLVRDDDGKPVHFVSQVIDLTERRRLEERLRDAAGRDPLTWLANRRGLQEWFDDVAGATQIGMIFVDLDGFKQINDDFGHAFGDRVLQQVARELRGLVRADDAVVRLGGDEFVVATILASVPDDFDRLVERLTARFESGLVVARPDDNGSPVTVLASVGAVAVEATTAMADALSAADAAMYTVKNQRRRSQPGGPVRHTGRR